MADPAANAEREFCDALMPLCFNAEQQNAQWKPYTFKCHEHRIKPLKALKYKKHTKFGFEIPSITPQRAYEIDQETGTTIG